MINKKNIYKFLIILIIIILLILIILIIFKRSYFVNNNNNNNNNNEKFINLDNNLINGQRLIVSLTTSPLRLNEIDKVIENINNQTIKPTKIYLNVPHYFKRNCEKYNLEKLNELKKYNNLEINFCEDKGPITKLYPTLEKENDGNTMIIILDDDMEYEDKLIEKLVSQFLENPEIVLANDVNIYATVKGIDTPGAYAGIIFKRSMFKDDFIDFVDKTGMYKNCYNSDDLIIGIYLKNKGVQVKQAKILGTHKSKDYSDGSDALKNQDNMYHIERYNKCKQFIDKML